jgi:hypothetical protein
MSGLPPVLGRVGALALLLSGVALVVFGVVLPFNARLSALEEDSRIAATAIERLSERVRHRDRFAERLAAFEKQVSASEEHIQAQTPALGAAVMQRLLTEAAVQHGVHVDSTQVVPGAPAIGLQRVVLRADIDGPFRGIAALLHGLESGLPYMFIEAVDMRASPGVAPNEMEDPSLSVRIDVAAVIVEPTS